MDLMSVEDNSKVYLDFYINLALQSKQVIDTLVTELQCLQAKVKTKQVKIEVSEVLQKTSAFKTNSIQPTPNIQKVEYDDATEELQLNRASVAQNHTQSQVQNPNESGHNLHSYFPHNSETEKEIVVENRNTIQNNLFWQNPYEVAFEANEDMSHQVETTIQEKYPPIHESFDPETEQEISHNQEHAPIQSNPVEAKVEEEEVVPEGFEFECPICDKTFSDNNSYLEHEKSHIQTQLKPHKCTTCSKAFSNPSLLDRHNRVHTGEKEVYCTTCGKGFSQKAALVYHVRVHTNERPYQCQYIDCGKSFKTAGQLTGHKRSHTGEKPFRCNTCGYEATHASHMKDHQRLHTAQ